MCKFICPLGWKVCWRHTHNDLNTHMFIESWRSKRKRKNTMKVRKNSADPVYGALNQELLAFQWAINDYMEKKCHFSMRWTIRLVTILNCNMCIWTVIHTHARHFSCAMYRKKNIKPIILMWWNLKVDLSVSMVTDLCL